MLKSWNLRRTNNLILAAIILLNLYVILAPFAPAVIFWYQKHATHRQSDLSRLIQSPSKTSSNQASSATTTKKFPNNSVVVPSMLLNAPILEGPVYQTYQILNKDTGAWRWPLGSTPDKGGNTILIGHRFTYTNPRGIFYELNKVKVNDKIAIFWNQKEYVYKVSSTKIILPSDTTILNQTKQAELTMYTCTPTWNPTHRIVVVAKLKQIIKPGEP